VLELDSIQRVLSIMRSTEFRTAIDSLPGYAVKDAGDIKTVLEVFRSDA
jgi:hypothetical protein